MVPDETVIRLRRSLVSERGIGLLELLAVVALGSVLLALSSQALWGSYQRNKSRLVATETVQVMQYARLKALKEKIRHRVVFNDDSASTPNTIVVQTEASGSFVTIPGQVYEAPEGVAIEGSGSRNSVDSVIVGTRGECETGSVFIAGYHGAQETVEIAVSCYASKA